MKKASDLNVILVIAIVLLTVGSCHKSKSPVPDLVLKVSLCDLYKNPAKYEGKRITVSATLTQLPSGKYLYPNPTNLCEGGFSFIKLNGDVLDKSELMDLEPSGVPSVRREFDIEVTGIFDSKYAEEFEAFRFRIVPSEIKRQSPVRSGKPLGAG